MGVLVNLYLGSYHLAVVPNLDSSIGQVHIIRFECPNRAPQLVHAFVLDFFLLSLILFTFGSSLLVNLA